MFVAIGSRLAYRQLVCVSDIIESDPSDILNLIDAARVEAARTLDPKEAERIMAKCQSIELDVHLTFTPNSLALVCCE